MYVHSWRCGKTFILMNVIKTWIWNKAAHVSRAKACVSITARMFWIQTASCSKLPPCTRATEAKAFLVQTRWTQTCCCCVAKDNNNNRKKKEVSEKCQKITGCHRTCASEPREGNEADHHGRWDPSSLWRRLHMQRRGSWLFVARRRPSSIKTVWQQKPTFFFTNHVFLHRLGGTARQSSDLKHGFTCDIYTACVLGWFLCEWQYVMIRTDTTRLWLMVMVHNVIALLSDSFRINKPSLKANVRLSFNRRKLAKGISTFAWAQPDVSNPFRL